MHNPLPYEDSNRATKFVFVEMTEFMSEMGYERPSIGINFEREETKVETRSGARTTKTTAEFDEPQGDKLSHEETKLNSPSKTSKSTRDILKMVIHNANLPFTYSDADAIPYELVKRDKLVLDQLIREGLVVDSGDRLLENKVERLDPSTILDTNVKCKEEYCPETYNKYCWCDR